MRLKKLLLGLLFFATLQIHAQNGLPPFAGAKGIALGDVGVAFNDINSGFSNQAGLADLESFGVSVAAESRFALAAIKSFGAVAAYPTKSGTFALNLNNFGGEAYNEQRIGLAYARKLFDKLSIGAQFDFINTSIENYGNKGLITFEIGFRSQLNKKLAIGGHFFSPARVAITTEEVVPTVYKLGAQYFVSEKVEIYGEVETDFDFPLQIKGGVQYAIIESLYLRAGVHTNPTLFNFGAGYNIKEAFAIDIAASYHQVLGFSPAISVSYFFQK